MPATESVGFLEDDIPYLKIGQGPPLVMVLGLTPEHDVPKGWGRRWELGLAEPLARHFTVYVVNRKRGLRPGESMSDIAGHLVDAIEHDLGEPVFLQGASTGGSVALQLAVDRPDLVRRLVVVSAAHRLGPRGRELQAELARLVRAGAPRDAWATAMTALMLPAPLQAPARRVVRLAVGPMVPADPTDMLATPILGGQGFDSGGLPMSTTKELVEADFQADNSGDIDAFVEHYADDAVLSHPGYPDGIVTGRDAIRRTWAEQRGGFPDSHIRSEVLVVEGDTAADEFTYTGTSTAPVPMPDGSTVPATGRHIEMKGMQLLKLRDGKVVRHELFLDSWVMMDQMGLAQPLSAPAAS